MTKRRGRNSRKLYVLKIALPFYIVFCLFAIIWLRAEVTSLEYELGSLNTIKTGLIREKKMVVAQRASFYSSEKVEKVAMNRLGMALPVRENVYYVKRTPVAGPYRTSAE